MFKTMWRLPRELSQCARVRILRSAIHGAASARVLYVCVLRSAPHRLDILVIVCEQANVSAPHIRSPRVCPGGAAEMQSLALIHSRPVHLHRGSEAPHAPNPVAV
jgi:hypothetical protein